jgi:hypothetical protein
MIGRFLANSLIEVGVVHPGPGGITGGRGLNAADLDLLGFIVLIDPFPDFTPDVLLQAGDFRLHLEGLPLVDLFSPGLLPRLLATGVRLFEGPLEFAEHQLQAAPFSLSCIQRWRPLCRGWSFRQWPSSRRPALLTLWLLLLSQLPQQAHQEPDYRKNYEPVELHA